MFTGIVAESGEVREVVDDEGGRRLTIAADEVLDGLDHGASVSVSGACLTVEAFDDETFEVFLASETLEKTYFDVVEVGDSVNLERALRADARLDGHFVQGHVDTVTEVVDVREVGEDWEYEFAVPEAYDAYVADKGSVALDGISLTVAERGEETFTVAVIPTTRELTNLSGKEPGDPVHLEVDVLAKYVERMLDD
ncbi:riboflavin synthase [Halomicrococcus gelatinilyticus]|uniref:riboflavin synthase n=1 Tax=Halomicrococcus gelatinilyticus TaxID=1702103 RepID=UPI002E135AE3